MRRMLFTVGMVVTAAVVHGGPLFSDDFESGLRQWTGQDSGGNDGLIVADPLRPGNHVLGFTGTKFGGDMFSLPALTLVEGQRYSFLVEYLGKPVLNSAPGNYGGFAGLSDVVLQNPYAMRYWPDPWYFGTEVNYPGLRVHLIDDGRWHSYSYTFVWHQAETGARSDAIHLMLEDYFDPLNPRINDSIGDVFFDNVQFVQVPEPSGLALLGLGAAGLLARAWRTDRTG
jgi:PEP-CTERM motif